MIFLGVFFSPTSMRLMDTGDANNTNAQCNLITSPPFTTKGLLSPGFIRRSVRLTVPNSGSRGFGTSPSPFKANGSTLATSPRVANSLFSDYIGETPVYPQAWMKGSRAQRPLLPPSDKDTVAMTTELSSRKRSLDDPVAESHHIYVQDDMELLFSTANHMTANGKIAKTDRRPFIKAQPSPLQPGPFINGVSGVAPAVLKRGEYRCGKCGHMPKKEKHSCASAAVQACHNAPVGTANSTSATEGTG